MRILLIGDLNSGLMAAKIGPLAASPWVERIVYISRYAGPPNDKVDYVVLPDVPGLLRRTFRRLRTAFAAMRHKPQLIFTYGLSPFGYMAWLLSRLYGVRYGIGVISGPLELAQGGVQIENRLLERFPFLAPLNEWFSLRALRRATFITTTGTATRDYLVRRGLAPERIYVLSSVIDPARYHPDDTALDIDIVCVSQLIARKRVDRLLSIAAALRPHHPGLTVAILGEGAEEAALKEQARALGLESCVTFAGWQPDVRPFVRRARLFTLTSVTEGLPLALIEAMACGVPGVVGRFGDVEDLIRDGVNGRLVPEGDVDAYAAAIGRLLADPDERARLSRNAAVTIAEGYTFAAGAEKWARIRDDWIAPAPGVRTTTYP